jgi:hypothetical protein
MVIQSRLLRVMENDTDSMTESRADAAHTVPKVHTIHAASTSYRTVLNSEDNAVPASKRNNHRSRLHARPLLRHHKLASRKVLTRFRQQYRELNRKNVFAVQVLMQAVVIVGAVPEQQRCWLDLTSLMTPFDEVDEVLGVTDVDTHRFIPTVRDRNKPRIEG